jgi:hypothetical protein
MDPQSKVSLGFIMPYSMLCKRRTPDQPNGRSRVGGPQLLKDKVYFVGDQPLAELQAVERLAARRISDKV